MELADEPLGPPRIYMFLGPEGSAHDPPPTKTCAHCQSEFIPSGPNQVYCSEECYLGKTGSDPEYWPRHDFEDDYQPDY